MILNLLGAFLVGYVAAWRVHTLRFYRLEQSRFHAFRHAYAAIQAACVNHTGWVRALTLLSEENIRTEMPKVNDQENRLTAVLAEIEAEEKVFPHNTRRF